MIKYLKRFYDLRIDNDLRQKDIANIINVKENTYSKWERGVNEIPIKMVCLLANYYKVSIDYMIGFSENKKKNYNFDSYNKKILCNRLYNARKRKKLSQQSIANIIGCSQRVYSGYESGYAVIPFSKLCTLCEYYNVSLDYMIGRSNDNDVKVLMHQ